MSGVVKIVLILVHLHIFVYYLSYFASCERVQILLVPFVNVELHRLYIALHFS